MLMMKVDASQLQMQPCGSAGLRWMVVVITVFVIINMEPGKQSPTGTWEHCIFTTEGTTEGTAYDQEARIDDSPMLI